MIGVSLSSVPIGLVVEQFSAKTRPSTAPARRRAWIFETSGRRIWMSHASGSRPMRSSCSRSWHTPPSAPDFLSTISLPKDAAIFQKDSRLGSFKAFAGIAFPGPLFSFLFFPSFRPV